MLRRGMLTWKVYVGGAPVNHCAKEPAHPLGTTAQAAAPNSVGECVDVDRRRASRLARSSRVAARQQRRLVRGHRRSRLLPRPWATWRRVPCATALLTWFFSSISSCAGAISGEQPGRGLKNAPSRTGHGPY